MEMGKGNNVFSNQEENTNKAKRIHIVSDWQRKAKELFDSQVFFNCRFKAFDYIEKLSDVSVAMLTVDIAKAKSFLGPNYNVKFSILYSENGQIYQTKNFFQTKLAGKESLIPDYILNAIGKEKESISIKFNMEDLKALYNERNIRIDEEATFKEISDICQKESVAFAHFVDRVFYTRIVCYNSNKEKIGVFHVGILHHMPKELEDKLYPGGQVECTF